MEECKEMVEDGVLKMVRKLKVVVGEKNDREASLAGLINEEVTTDEWNEKASADDDRREEIRVKEVQKGREAVFDVTNGLQEDSIATMLTDEDLELELPGDEDADVSELFEVD